MKDDLKRFEEHLRGLRRLESAGGKTTKFRATLHMTIDGREVEFALDETGAGVVAANRNVYHTGDTPYEAYLRHLDAQKKKEKKGAGRKDVADELIKLLNALAKKAESGSDHYYGQITGKESHSGHNYWQISLKRIDGPGWRPSHLKIYHNVTTNKFKFDSYSADRPADSNWVTPQTFLNKLSKHKELLPMLADPNLLEEGDDEQEQ